MPMVPTEVFRTPSPPLPPNIDPVFARVVIEMDNTPVGRPLILPVGVTVIEPSVPTIGRDGR
jgi:hypothetical protein